MDSRESEVFQKVADFAAEQVGAEPSSIRPETHFTNDLKFDSLDLVDFMMKVEEEFELPVPDNEAEKIKTVGQVVSYILEARKER